MKRLLTIAAVLLSLCCAAFGQAADTKAKPKKAAAEGSKLSQLTGCLNSPNAGAYTLTNGHYKSGVTVNGPDELKSHVGHQVRMKGTWSEDKKSYKAESVSQVADTCPALGSAAAGGKTKAGKTKGEAPKQ